MKRNFLTLLAAVLAIGFTAFTTISKSTSQVANESAFSIVYYEYKTGAQSNPANYDKRTTPVATCPGSLSLCTVVVTDQDSDSDVDDTDFGILFNSLDAIPNGSLNDESEQTGLLEKKG